MTILSYFVSEYSLGLTGAYQTWKNTMWRSMEVVFVNQPVKIMMYDVLSYEDISDTELIRNERDGMWWKCATISTKAIVSKLHVCH